MLGSAYGLQELKNGDNLPMTQMLTSPDDLAIYIIA
jgi:hypothetical protein